MKYSPKFIKELKENEIFVFGSNLSGRHFAGAADTARRFFGAEVGVGEGLMGKSYALPTKNYRIETLYLDEIKIHVDRFIDFAKGSPQYVFLVTKIGTGLAGITIAEIAPLFRRALEIENIRLPQEFVESMNYDKIT